MVTNDPIRYPIITLGKAYIPVDQLAAKGSFDRYMEVPSDIIPTIGGILGVRDDGNIAMATMDNSNKIYVNSGASSGGGGGASAFAPNQSDFDFVTATSRSSPLRCRLNTRGMVTCWRLRIDVSFDGSNNTADEPAYGDISIYSSSGTSTFLGFIWGPAPQNVSNGNSASTGFMDLIFPGGWSNPVFYNSADTYTDVYCGTVDFVNGFSASILFS